MDAGAGAGAGAGSPARPAPLRATKKIGSLTMATNYGPDDTAFDIVDIPPAARVAKKEVRRSKRPNILGTEKRSWNSSTLQDDNPLCKQRKHVLKAHDRSQFKYNYRAEKLPESAPIEVTDVVRQQFRSTLRTTSRMADIPVHPELEDKASWNSSTQLTTHERSAMFSTVHMGATKNSRRKNVGVKDYKDPMTLEREFMSKHRTMRAKGIRDAGASITKAPETDEPTTAKVVSFTHTVSRKFRKYHHSGKYEKSRFDPGNAWSCCMASEEGARGCIVTTVNPDAYNFASIN